MTSARWRAVSGRDGKFERGDADMSHRHFADPILPVLFPHRVFKTSSWPWRTPPPASGLIMPPSPRPSAQSQPAVCHGQIQVWLWRMLGPRWIHRKAGPCFRRVVCFKFLPGMSSTNPIVGFRTGLQPTTQAPRNNSFLWRLPRRPWICAP